MNTFILSNVKIITQYGIINNGYVYVKRGIIMAIGRSSPVKVHRSCHVIDGDGGWLLPGIVDINNYLFGKGSNSSFFTLESNFASHGITSIFHTISRSELDKDVQLNKLRSLGIIRHHFQANLPFTDSFFIISAPAVHIEAENHISPTFADMIRHPSMYIICSDDISSSILQSIFMLHHDYGLSLADAVGMATINPAKALGFETKFGSIEWGKTADLILTDRSDDNPAIKKVYVSGCVIFDSAGMEQTSIM